MEFFENYENNASGINSEDFPFICRVCLRRGELRLFEEEVNLLDLFLVITKIDVCSTENFPRTICNECINKLADISSFIDVSRNNESSQGKHFIPKKENQHIAEDGCRTLQEPVVKTEEYDEYVYSEICRICLSTRSGLTLFEEKAYLMQLFQNITNIYVEAECNFFNRNRICNKCIDKLESISSFINLSLCSDVKLKSTIGRNGALKTEHYSENNTIDVCLLSGNDIKFERTLDRIEVKMENNFDDSPWSNESRDLHTTVDMKEEFNRPKAPIQQNSLEGLEFSSGTNCVEEPSECDPREYDFSNENQMKIMSEASSGDLLSINQFDCEFCDESFTKEHRLEQHLSIHSQESSSRCYGCAKSFTSKSSLWQHMLLIHAGGRLAFECDRCEQSFEHEQQLKEHSKTHGGTEAFKCGRCSESFHRKRLLEEHMLVHAAGTPFKCDCCERSFALEPDLQWHKLAHAGEKSLKCDRCEKTFNHKHSFKMHALTHTGEKPFKCDGCERSFNHKSNLLRHTFTHTGRKPFKCDRCGRSFSHKKNLRRHSLTTTGGKAFECDCCEKSFCQKNLLQKHMLAAHAGTGQKVFKCACCEKMFKYKHSLDEHMVRHTGETPFKCDCCEKRFSHKSSLRKHLLRGHPLMASNLESLK